MHRFAADRLTCLAVAWACLAVAGCGSDAVVTGPKLIAGDTVNDVGGLDGLGDSAAGDGQVGTDGQGEVGADAPLVDADVLALDGVDATVTDEGLTEGLADGDDTEPSDIIEDTGIDAEPGEGLAGDATEADGDTTDEGDTADGDLTSIDGGTEDGDAIDGTGDAENPDVITSTSLCNPCKASAECAGGTCVAFGDAGAFCGQDCKTDAECPAGNTCKDIKTVDGQIGQQCVPAPAAGEAFGACACSNAAIAGGLSTQCFLTVTDANGKLIGKCAGSRSCGAAGLTGCDAAAAAAETCDGSDNDCNGQVDDGTACDDGNPCTTDACTNKKCAFTNNDAPCEADANECTADKCLDGACNPGATKVCADDGNPCTDDVCQKGLGCKHPNVDGKTCSVGGGFCTSGGCLNGACSPVENQGCNDANPCTADSCDPKTGSCSNAAVDGTACDDGTACTDKDSCAAGKCSGAAVKCDDGNPCTTDTCDAKTGCVSTAAADGTACEDGNKCTTGDACKAATCLAGPPVTCTPNQPCQLASCDASNGQCVTGLAADGTACDDANACTQGETCGGGLCAGTVVSCNDSNACTDDKCDPLKGCLSTANQDSCEDGNPCTVGDKCGGAGCVSGAAKTCEDGNSCTLDACDSGSGDCSHIAQSVACDDGKVCTGGDVCVGGACTGTPQTCDDGNPCTVDDCDIIKGCTHIAGAAGVPCDDADACTLGDACTAGACAGNAKLDCNDANPCTDDTCDVKAGCAHAGNTAACDDGNACTSGDACADGKCASGVFTCTCTVTADCAKSEDADLCNGTLVCSDNKCVLDPATVVTCPADQDTACQQSQCDVKSGQCGLQPVNAGKPCNDSSACSVAEACAGGACTGGQAVVCDDKNPCTTDSCDGVQGCVFLANTATCTDANACTTTDACKDSLCVGTPVNCDDGNACTGDSCDPIAACVHAATTAACSDGNVCTSDDACSAGKCVAGAAKSCGDANPCTNDSCDAVKGCLYANNNQACDDNNLCTANDLCGSGKCAGALAKVCNDNNPCTTDSCDGKTGNCGFAPIVGCGGNCKVDADCPQPANSCQVPFCDAISLKCGNKIAVNGAICNDANGCTVGEVCTNGACAGGKATVCNDNNSCTADSCDKLSGKCLFGNVNNVPCNDANPCSTNDTCTGGTCLGGAAKICTDFNPCTADSCNKTSGSCVFAPIAGCSGACKIDADCGKSTSPCLVNYCDATKAACAQKPAANLTACADGNACSQTDVCFNGVCQGSNFKNCNDNNLCTDDSCNVTTGGCVAVNNAAGCTDGNACTSGDACSGGKCVAGAAKLCDDKNPCTANSCNMGNGQCQFPGIPGCGGFCTKDADCPVSKLACTVAACDLATQQCTSKVMADGTACNDQNACSPTSTCQLGSCVGQSPKVCNDGNACTTDSCNTTTGACVFAAQSGTACSDGNACTGADLCQAGACKAGGQKVCNDGNVCSADSCDQASGLCAFTPIAGCGGNCATDLDCPSTGNFCTTEVCNLKLKQCIVQAVPNGSACDDGVACTVNDVCKNGACSSGGIKACTDGNPCTADACATATGACVHTAQSGQPCNDASPCTSNDLCSKGACAGTAKSCDDGKPCTADSCDAKSGACLHAVIAGCGGACKADADCKASGKPCLLSYCNTGTCSVKNAANGAPCTDGNACTLTDACKAGACASGVSKVCDDGNACTTDACNTATGGCTTSPTAVLPCNDGNPCTFSDICQNSKCAGFAKACNDGKKCTADACDTKTGNCTFTPIVGCK